MRYQTVKSCAIDIVNSKNNNNSPNSNLNNYYSHYNNYLSCQIPPNHNSPPEGDYINLYLNSVLEHKKLHLNVEAYKAYK